MTRRHAFTTALPAAASLSRPRPDVPLTAVHHSEPHANEVPAAPPQAARLYSKGAAEPAFSRIVVSDAQGEPVSDARAAADTAGHKLLELALPPLAGGTCRVT